MGAGFFCFFGGQAFLIVVVEGQRSKVKGER